MTPPAASPSPEPDWLAVRQLFDAAAERPPGQRAAFVDAAAASGAVKAEVHSLLAHHDDLGDPSDAGTFLNTPAAAQWAGDEGPSREGQRFGAWQIVRAVGAGGMGEVFEARRADGSFEGRAAIKLLKRGMDSAAVLRRFAQERQTLARLNHPNVATLFDAGLSADGLPYFVMAFVDGVPIDEAARTLPIEARLALFLQLADAVSHAHRNLLVHRDLKPGNVLVTQAGTVKLLDFGIAKALDPADPADLIHAFDTTVGTLRPFTPNYASPEQIRGEPVSTATDIYSLGVLLYQLLTGVRPTGRSASTPAEAARSVLEEEPTRPSALPPGRAADAKWLATRKRLRGDLDNILLKALNKTIERRYASVEALAADVRAHLSGHPVGARAPSAGYVAAKFVARNRVAVAAAGAALLAVLSGFAASTWQAHEARLARDDARRQLGEIKRITTELVFRFGDAVTRLPGGMKAEEAMLQQTLISLDSALKAAPQDADLIALVASALGRIAELQGNAALASPLRAAEADATVQRGLALAERVWDEKKTHWRFASWHVRTRCMQSLLLRNRGKPGEGLASLGIAIERASETLRQPLTGEGRAHMIAARGAAHMLAAQMNTHATQPSLGRPDLALPQFERAEADYRDLLADTRLLAELDRDAAPGDSPASHTFSHQLAAIQAGQAVAHGRLDDVPRMRRLAESAYALRQQNLLSEPGNLYWRDGVVGDANTLAGALLRGGDAAAALAVSQAGWNLNATLAREQGPKSKWARLDATLAPAHAQALAGTGRHTDALAVFDIAIAPLAAVKADQRTPAEQRRLAWLQALRGRSMAALGRPADATALLQAAAASLRFLATQALPDRDAELALAQALAALAGLQPKSAAALREEAAAALRRAADRQPLGEDHLRLMASLG